MSQASPTRMNYLARRNQLKLAVKGVDLLQKKRDALVREFFALAHETVEVRRQLNAAAREAHGALLLAKSFDGPGAVDSACTAVPALTDVRAEVDSVWGTRVTRLEVEGPGGVTGSPLGVGGQTVSAQAAFRRLSRSLIRVVNVENRLRRIGEEIKKTARRVNALEIVVIPGIRSEMHSIQQVLEQREREDIFRLKRIKSKMESRES